MSKPSPFDADPFAAALEAAAPKPKRPTRSESPAPTPTRQDVPGNDEPQAEQTARIDALKAAVDAIEDGIYFDLPEEIYHAVPRLSASGLQKLCISPATFWKGSWLDPDRPDRLDEEQTKAQLIGKAYHCARLEPDSFHERFVRELAKADYPKGTLFTGTDMGKALADMGASKSGSVAEQAARLVELGYSGAIWHVDLAEWEAQRGGRAAIPAEKWDEIVIDMERIRNNGDIVDLLDGGAAEVSVFWTDELGLKMKSRMDKLTPDHWTDLKTFDNSRGVRLEEAISNFVRYNRVHVQAVTYRDAVEAIRTGGLQVRGDATAAQHTLIAAIQIKPEELACWYIFQEKNGVPNLLAREFEFFGVDDTHIGAWDAGATEEGVARGHAAVRHRTPLHVRARMDITKAKEDFMLYSQVYEPGHPWFPIDGARRAFDSLDFNTFWLEGRS